MRPVQFTREKIPDADLCFVKKKVDSIRALFRKNCAECGIVREVVRLDTEMYEESWESAHACVVKYI
jgi:hypothetical protein